MALNISCIFIVIHIDKCFINDILLYKRYNILLFKTKKVDDVVLFIYLGLHFYSRFTFLFKERKKMKSFKLTLLAIATALFLQGCGDDNDSDGSSLTPPDQSDINTEILGVWTGSDTDDELLTLVFLDDGTYIHLEVNEKPEIARMQSLRQALANPEGGMEWGKYTIDDETGKLTTTPVFDNNGSAGLSDAVTRYVRVSNGNLTLEVDENNDGVISSDETSDFSETKSEGLLGAWGSDDIDEGLLGLAFFEDGTYVHVRVDAEGSTNNPNNGMEWGTYTIDEATGALTTSQLFDNNGESGLSDPLVRYARLVNGKLVIEVDNNKNGIIDFNEKFGFSKRTADNIPLDKVDPKELIGLWENKNTNNELLTLAFLEDGTYIHLEVDENMPFDTSNREISGMEWGNYTLNNRTGELSVNQKFDNNGDTGLSDPLDRYVSVSGNTLTLKVDENKNGVIDSNESFAFTKAKSENLLGFWKNNTTGNELLAFAFFDDGTYVHMEVDEKPPFDNTENEKSGMEWGNYTLNSTTKALTVSQIFDNNGTTGLSDPIARYARVSGNILTLEFDENNNGIIGSDESLNFTRQ